jgi:hypothetical protein
MCEGRLVANRWNVIEASVWSTAVGSYRTLGRALAGDEERVASAAESGRLGALCDLARLG